MIILCVEDYCHDCLDFEPDITKPQALLSSEGPVCVLGDFVITCEHVKLCERLLNKHKERLSKE